MLFIAIERDGIAPRCSLLGFDAGVLDLQNPKNTQSPKKGICKTTLMITDSVRMVMVV